MHRAFLIAAIALSSLVIGPVSSAAAAPNTENRCGYLSNPTPGNWWLTDRDGEWTIGAQGGYQADGLDVLPESFYEKGWVKTNGWYGYRCACLTVTTDRKAMRIKRIYGGKPLPMKRCTADKAIRRGG
ncbi:MAG: DUF4087 domain-containing protein [Novosphingobium sp.]|nr:DUF4087 domain-containing protein [Novosphingobium sp.]